MRQKIKCTQNAVNSVLSREQIAEFYEKYSLTVYRVCYSFVKNEADASDIMQETFLKWLTCENPPAGEEHETGWLVVTAGNLCKNFLKRRRHLDFDGFAEYEKNGREDTAHKKNELLDAVMRLPDKYKTAVFLFYYKDYSTEKIAQITGQRKSTVRSQLKRAREILHRELGDDFNE